MQGILEVHRKAIHKTAAPFYPIEILSDWAPPLNEAAIHKFIADKGKTEIITVAERNGKIIRFSEVRPDNHELRAVYIDPDFGRRGGWNNTLKNC